MLLKEVEEVSAAAAAAGAAAATAKGASIIVATIDFCSCCFRVRESKKPTIRMRAATFNSLSLIPQRVRRKRGGQQAPPKKKIRERRNSLLALKKPNGER